MSTLTLVKRPAPVLEVHNEKAIRELVERCIKRGWCKRPKQPLVLTVEQEMAALKRRITELEEEATVE